MLKVTIELISAVDGSRKEWQGVIYNDGTGTPESGNYIAAFGPKGGKLSAKQITDTRAQRGWRYATLQGFPRKRLGPWSLLRQLLEKTEDTR